MSPVVVDPLVSRTWLRPLVAIFALSTFAPPLVAQKQSVDELAVEAIRHPEDLELNLWADSTQLANPVAFAFDDQGNMYICETFRQNRGVEDNRGHMDWLDDDLAAQTIEDRLAYFQKHLGADIQKYTEYEDRITRLADSDGDGRADQYGVFADGFRDVLTGTGAGVLAHQGEVFYTCIPDVWKLKDRDHDGAADVRESLHSGYGVRVAFRGHDLHGLIMGPDGRLYFSIGDRGYSITTADGRQLHDPASGAVFRCELDGSGLEVFATGLRNPQELAFDDVGNLFTGDNNSDGGDQARMVHVVEGGDTGWRMYYQYLRDRGPWNREKLWHPQHAGQAAYHLPPICNFADGPSGFAFYPGTGLGQEYNQTFFLCDFRGDAAISGVRSFQLEAEGASFRMTNARRFLWNLLATDVDFGPDGAMYLTDWIEGWNGVNRGRVIRVTNPHERNSKRSKRVQLLVGKSFSADKLGALITRLGHVDRRIRMKSQLELVRRGVVWQLAKVARQNKRDLARLHATWGLGQIARTSDNPQKRQRAINALLPRMTDRWAVIRRAAMQTLGELRVDQAVPGIREALQDADAGVQAAAGIAIGKFPSADVRQNLIALLVENNDQDAVLRHAGVLGLVGTCSIADLLALQDHDHVSVRRAAVVALRRRAAPEVAAFLHDPDASVVYEAALAIHDLPLADAMPKLAELLDQDRPLSDPIARRVLNANFRLGSAPHASALAHTLGRPEISLAMQREALSMLRDWTTPSNRDRVLGDWRPLSERTAQAAVDAVTEAFERVATYEPEVAIATVRLAADLKIAAAAHQAASMITDDRFAPEQRATLLESLHQLDPSAAQSVVDEVLRDDSPVVRAAARKVYVRLDTTVGVQALVDAIAQGTVTEQQSAFRQLGQLQNQAARAALERLASDLLESGKLPPEVHLDAVDAIRKQGLEAKIAGFLEQLKKRPYGELHLATRGGDAGRGEAVFTGNITLSCTRCHKAGRSGGRVGPNLAGIGAQKSPEYLLESIVDPNKTIAEGFGTLNLILEDGQQKQGVLQKETADYVQLVDAEANQFIVMKSEVELRANGQSAMPEELTKGLRLYDLRDLLAFLQSLKTPWDEASAGHE